MDHTDLTAIMRFVRILRQDIDAVKNSIELPWSNGDRQRADQPSQDAEASHVWQGRARTDEGENAAAESQKVRKNPLKAKCGRNRRILTFKGQTTTV